MQYNHIFLWAPYGQHVGQEYVDVGCGRGENYTNWDWCAAALRTFVCTIDLLLRLA